MTENNNNDDAIETMAEPIDITKLPHDKALAILGDTIAEQNDTIVRLRGIVEHMARAIRTISNVAGNMLGEIPTEDELKKAEDGEAH